MTAVNLSQSRPYRWTAALIVVIHSVLLMWGALRHSPPWDEVAHLPAGISHWHLGTFTLHRVNPPLVRLVASAPVALMMNPATDWTGYDESVGTRCERAIRPRFLEINRARIFWLYTVARWFCLPFSWLGAYVCFRWALELYGPLAGLLALTLWCFSPNILTHAQLMTPDAGASALGMAAAYAFWEWLRGGAWPAVVWAGCTLGLALLTKLTWIILFPLWLCTWIGWRLTEPRRQQPRVDASAKQLLAIFILGLYVLNLGYGFEGSFTPLGRYGFVSQALTGRSGTESATLMPGNRFAGTWLGLLPVPFPSNYVMGIDLQKSDFEREMLSYLRGEWKVGGWWYYYLYALAIKVPLGTWLLVVLNVDLCLRRVGPCFAYGRPAAPPESTPKNVSAPFRTRPRDELLVLIPLVAVLILVSSQTGFSHHLRYVLPVFPFAFIWIGRLAREVAGTSGPLKYLVAISIIWSVTSSLWIYPHSMSYFNELVGGPRHGHEHLGGIPHDSNIDSGQDLLYLKRWIAQHPEARPLHIAFNGLYGPELAGIDYQPATPQPQPGWHAISVNRLRSRGGTFDEYLRLHHVDLIGYSIYVYRVE